MDKVDGFTILLILFILAVCGYIYYHSDAFQLKCIISTVDGNTYCVRDRERIQDAADILAKITGKCRDLVSFMNEKHPDKDNVKRLVNGYNPQKICETLPTSTYTAYSENKGEKIAFCLNKKREEEDNLIDEHTLMFVAIHEMAHVATKSIGHKTEFWDNFKFLLENAQECGVHMPKDYKTNPVEYCGMDIHDNPFYDM